jgi:O-acetyl-ADP-ribose deacetylase (regulator of RNase III)
MPYPIELWLVHPREEACAAFRDRFADLPGVRVMQTRFETLDPHDCFITAGNGFGVMTAGIDAAVVAFHGTGLMERVQRRIIDEYLGEQPVGTCFLEATGTPGYPFVGHAPTMRMPGPIDGTDAVYRAAWAALLAVYRHNAAVRREEADGPEIVTVAMPALGTGFGTWSSRRRRGRWRRRTAFTWIRRTAWTGTRRSAGTGRSGSMGRTGWRGRVRPGASANR